MSPLPNPSPCPSDLEIADLIAGRLAGQAREALLRHLASCEDCYALWAEAQALLAEHAGAAPPAPAAAPAGKTAPPLPFPPRRRWVAGWLPSLAASALLGIGLAWWLPGRAAGPAPGKAAWPSLGALPPFAAPPAGVTPLPTGSSESRGNRRREEQTAADFFFGAAWAHLEAAAAAGLAAETRATAARLAAALPACGGDLTPDLRGDAAALLASLASPGEPPPAAALEPAATRLAAEMATLGYEFDLGRFAERGRLAAEAGDAEFFDPRGEPARFLWALQAKGADLAPKARTGVAGIASAWPAGTEPIGKPFEPAAAAFAELFLAYDR